MGARFVDPKSGDVYEGVPDELVTSHGLVSEEQYAKDQAYEAKPLGEKGIDALTSTAGALAQPIDAADTALSNMAAGRAVPDAPGPGETEADVAARGGVSAGSSLSPEMRELQARHPIATAVGAGLREAPLAAISGIPGAVVRVGSAALLGSADSSFAAGEGYVPNARDATTYGALQAFFEGAAGVGGLVARTLRANRPALEQAAERAEGFAATARVERDAAIKSERYAAEAPLHVERLTKEGEEAFHGVAKAVSDVDEALTGLKVKANESAARAAAVDVRTELREQLDALRELPSPREGEIVRPPAVEGQAEAGARAVQEIRAKLGLGGQPVPVPVTEAGTPKGGPRRPGKKLSEMTPEAAAETRANLESEAAIARKTPFSQKPQPDSATAARTTMARVIDLIDETEPKNLYAVLRDSRNALSGLQGSASAVDALDGALKRVDVFGKAATDYTKAADAGILRAREAWERISSELATNGVPDAGKLRSFVSKPSANVGLRQDVQEALEGLDASASLLRSAGRPELVKKVAAASAQLRSVVDEADEVFGAVTAQRLSGKAPTGLGAKLQRAVASKAGRMAGGAVGGIVGGWPGAVTGSVIGEALEEPAMALMARMNTYRARDIGHTARAMVYRSAPTVERAAARVASIAPAAGIGVRASSRAFLGDYDTPRQAYDASIKAVNSPPEKLADAIGSGLDGVPNDVREQIALQSFQTQQFLKSKMPTGIGVSLRNPEGIPPSRYAIAKWSLYYTAALNPSTVYADLAAGKAQLEQIETLKALHPDDYNDLRDESIRLLSSGAKPNVQQRARLHLLFDIGENVDPFFSPSLGAMIQNAQQRMKQPKPAPRMPQSNNTAASRFASPQKTLENA